MAETDRPEPLHQDPDAEVIVSGGGDGGVGAAIGIAVVVLVVVLLASLFFGDALFHGIELPADDPPDLSEVSEVDADDDVGDLNDEPADAVSG